MNNRGLEHARSVEWCFGTIVIRAQRFGVEIVGDIENWVSLENRDAFMDLLTTAFQTATEITEAYKSN